jgi:hypothetical protein
MGHSAKKGAVMSRIAAKSGPTLMPIAPAATNSALAAVMDWKDTHAEISCRFTTSADPNPTKILPQKATCIDLQEDASPYNKFPRKGKKAEKNRADRKELLVYQNE